MSNALLIQNGRVVDPAQNLDQVADVLIVDGKIAALGADAVAQAPENVKKFDASLARWTVKVFVFCVLHT